MILLPSKVISSHGNIANCKYSKHQQCSGDKGTINHAVWGDLISDIRTLPAQFYCTQIQKRTYEEYVFIYLLKCVEVVVIHLTGVRLTLQNIYTKQGIMIQPNTDDK